MNDIHDFRFIKRRMGSVLSYMWDWFGVPLVAIVAGCFIVIGITKLVFHQCKKSCLSCWVPEVKQRRARYPRRKHGSTVSNAQAPIVNYNISGPGQIVEHAPPPYTSDISRNKSANQNLLYPTVPPDLSTVEAATTETCLPSAPAYEDIVSKPVSTCHVLNECLLPNEYNALRETIPCAPDYKGESSFEVINEKIVQNPPELRENDTCNTASAQDIDIPRTSIECVQDSERDIRIQVVKETFVQSGAAVDESDSDSDSCTQKCKVESSESQVNENESLMIPETPISKPCATIECAAEPIREARIMCVTESLVQTPAIGGAPRSRGPRPMQETCVNCSIVLPRLELVDHLQVSHCKDTQAGKEQCNTLQRQVLPNVTMIAANWYPMQT